MFKLLADWANCRPLQSDAIDVSRLEDRVLFSATPISAVAGGAEPPIAAGDEPFESNQLIDATNAQGESESFQLTDRSREIDEQTSLELVFIDSATEDYQQLIDDLLQDSDPNREFEVYLLEADRNGIGQISSILQGYQQVDAIHLLSHGTEGGLKLGDTWLSNDNLAAYSGEIASWGQSLSPEADLLVYGCDLAASEAGRSLVESLGALCDCDVAASDDDTGHDFFGGDWDLEYSTGHIETDIAFSEYLLENWGHLLNVTVDATTTDTSPVGAASDSVVHTTSGTDRLMLVGISFGSDQGDSVSVASPPTYNGTALTLVGTQENADSLASRVEIWSLVAPDTGTHTLDITYTGTSHQGATIGVMTFNGVDQATALGSFTGSDGNSSDPTMTVSSATGELVFGVAAFSDSNDWDLIEGGGQTEHWDLFTVGGEANGAGTTEAGAASVLTDWTVATARKWAAGGVSIKASQTDISGTVFEDVDGDGDVFDDNVGVAGVTVYLFQDTGDGDPDGGDTPMGSTTTDGSGDYFFNDLADATYWIVVDSTTVAPSAGFNGGYDQNDVWAEQTYGSAGAATFSGSYAYATGAGALFGGVQNGVSDDASGLATAEHVTRVIVSGADAVDVDSGFSFSVVTHNGDSDDDGVNERTSQGALRQAIQNANAISGDATIDLPADNYDLAIGGAGENLSAAGDLDILGKLTIAGTDAATTIINQTSTDRVFDVHGTTGDLSLSQVTVQGGNGVLDGGGFLVDSGANLTLNNVVVYNNMAGNGAGIHNSGTINLTDVEIWDNGDRVATVQGGGLYNGGKATVDRVTFYLNEADSGGGIYNDFGAGDYLDLTNVTVSTNTADSVGGGLYTRDLATIINSTFTLNSAASGGGIRTQGASGDVDLKNTIVAQNTIVSANPDLQGNYITSGNNLIGDGTGQSDLVDGVNGDQVGSGGSPIDAMLGGLAPNGGFTQTHALLAGSAAINSGTAVGAPPTDQRGNARFGATDIGAYESALTAAPTLDLDGDNSSGATGNDYQFTYAEGDGPTSIADGDLDLADVDSSNFDHVTLQITGLLDGNDETLALDGDIFALATAEPGQNTGGGSYHVVITTGAGTANVTVTKQGGGTFSEAETETLIQAIQYQHTDTFNPTDGDRLIDVTVNDGSTDSAAARTTINMDPISIAPGGIGANLSLWLDAGTGVTTGAGGVSQWDNRVTNGTLPNVQQASPGDRPDLAASALNFNPVIQFDDANEDDLGDASVLGSDLFASDQASIFTVANLNSGSIIMQWRETGANRVTIEGSGPRFDFGDQTNDSITGSGWGPGYHIVNTQASPGAQALMEIFVDGELNTSGFASVSNPVDDTATGSFRLGEYPFAPPNFNANMDLAEVIVYRSGLNAADQLKVESYLAVKYGITLDQSSPSNYVDSGGTVVWDAAANLLYRHDIAGIGRDDASTLNQTQSQSINSDSIVAISAATSQDDGDFLLWGNNNGALTETAAGNPIGVNQRLQRVWRVDETGELGTTTIQFDVNSLPVSGTATSDFNLIIDNDTDFSSGATLVAASSYTSGIVTFSNVNLGDAEYFALGTVGNTAPTLDLDGDNSSGATGDDYQFTYAEGDGPIGIADADLDLADVDSSNFDHVTLQITGLLDGNDETLALDGDIFALATAEPGQNTTGGGYHVVITTGAGTANVTVTKQGGGTFSEAETETLVQAIQYQHTDTINPTDGNRLIDVTVNDGSADSVAATTTIDVDTQTDIRGTIYEDVDGDGDVFDDNVGVAGVTVYLFQDTGDGDPDGGDTPMGSTTTDGSGDYFFNDLADATYWIVVDSTTVAPSAGFNGGHGQNDVWAEQTYGSTGAATFSGSYAYASGAGALLGGVQNGVSDDASGLATAEHVTRVIASGADAVDVDSGFSFTVVTHNGDSDDDGPNERTAQGTLRQAIQNANAISGDAAIDLPADNYVLAIGGTGENDGETGDLDVTENLTINGAGAGTTVIDAGSIDRVFEVRGAFVSLTMSDVSVEGGSINNDGGGIYVEHNDGQLTLSRVIVTNNMADDGGGIFNEGTINLTDVVISNNGDVLTTREGGGIHNRGVAVLNRVTLNGNEADEGGGIHSDGAATSLALTNVTASGNTASTTGGGLQTESPVTIVNSTFTENWAVLGGGIRSQDNVDLLNTIVAGNTAGIANPDLEGALGEFTTSGYNLIGDGTGQFDLVDGANNDQVGSGGSPIDAMLGGLAPNGGFTQTHALLAGSAAINSGTAAGAPPTDQRGIARVGAIDIGAYESALTAAPTLDLDGDNSGGATGNDYQFTFTEGDGPTSIADGDLDLADVDSSNFDHVTLQITGLLDGNDETLALDGDIFALATAEPGQNTTGGGYHVVITTGAGTANVTVTKQGGGTFSEAETEILIQAIQYQHTDTFNPTDGNRLIDVTVNDGLADSAAARATVNVNPLNSAPTADAGGAYVINEGNGITLDGTASTDPETDPLTYNWDLDNDGLFDDAVGGLVPLTWAQLGLHGINDDGVFTIGLEVDDGNGAQNSQLTTITVNNLPPAAVDDAFVTGEETAFTTGDVTANDSEPNANDTILVVGINTTGTLGVVTDNGDGTFDYDPDGQFEALAAGASTTDSFTYTLQDDDGGASIATVTITVNGANDPPMIAGVTGDSSAYAEGSGAQVIEQGGDAAATDVDSTNFAGGQLRIGIQAGGNVVEDVLSIRHQGNGGGQIGFAAGVVSYEGTAIGTAVGGALGADLVINFNVNATPDAASALIRNVTYENVNVVSATSGARTIRFTVSDGDGGVSLSHDASINVTTVNSDPSITSPAVAMVTENTVTVMTVTSTDPDGGAPQYSIAGGADGARFSIVTATGELRFTSAPNFESPTDVGGDNTYEVLVAVDDGNGGTDSQLISVTVTDDNDLPNAENDSYSVTENEVLTVAPSGVLANDSDEDGGLTATVTIGPVNGALVFNANGSFVYTPDADFTGNDSFTYRVDDLAGATDTATVSITVNPAGGPVEEPPEVDPPDEPSEDAESSEEPDLEPDPPAEELIPPGESPSADAARRGSLSTDGRGNETMVLPETSSELIQISQRSSQDFAVAAVQNGKPAVDPGGKLVATAVSLAMDADWQPYVADFNAQLLWNDLKQLDQQIQQETNAPYLVAGSAAGMTSLFTVGYVLWTIRSGWLVTSLLVQMPAWRLVDPLVVLDYLDDNDGDDSDDDDDSLETMLERQSTEDEEKASVAMDEEKAVHV